MYKKVEEFIMSFEERDVEEKYRDYIRNYPYVMTGAGIVNILNKSCSFIDSDKCYLEVGTHRGSTLCGAALENESLYFYGVDTFEGHASKQEIEPFGNVEDGLKDAIEKFGHSNVSYFKSDYVDFFRARETVEKRKIEVYMYDGDHQRQHQYQGIEIALPTLSDQAVIFVDDSSNNDKGAVWGAIGDLLKKYSELSVLREWKHGGGPQGDRGPRGKDRGLGPGLHGDMWCGLVALKFERN